MTNKLTRTRGQGGTLVPTMPSYPTGTGVDTQAIARSGWASWNKENELTRARGLIEREADVLAALRRRTLEEIELTRTVLCGGMRIEQDVAEHRLQLAEYGLETMLVTEQARAAELRMRQREDAYHEARLLRREDFRRQLGAPRTEPRFEFDFEPARDDEVIDD